MAPGLVERSLAFDMPVGTADAEQDQGNARKHCCRSPDRSLQVLVLAKESHFVSVIVAEEELKGPTGNQRGMHTLTTKRREKRS